MAEGSALRITYDESRWPCVVITMPARELSDEEFLLHVADMAAYSARGPRFGFVIDVRTAPTPNAARRRMMAEEMDRAIERDGPRCLGVALVLDDKIRRAVFNTIQWLRRSDHPLTAVATPEEGIVWLRQARSQHLQRAS